MQLADMIQGVLHPSEAAVGGEGRFLTMPTVVLDTYFRRSLSTTETP